jgi:hypothetical protein
MFRFITTTPLFLAIGSASAHSAGGHHEGIAANALHFMTQLNHVGPALLLALLLAGLGVAFKGRSKSKRVQ